ncbi:2-phospho-L-lactate guanylyltransferase [Microbacterium koreense]|uniref:2-phospho-L-lactate guanylyltransferase n=1 Tax=Microbacterium koreense TaxID=323761 RepID=A0ABW2ZN04_9MICO
MTSGWILVIPVKDPTRGKTRLNVDGVDRVALARALAADTIAAAAACDEVAQIVVVGDDGSVVLDSLEVRGLRFVPEGERRGLDAAVATGVTAFPDRPRAALLGDLPALDPTDLARALRAARTLARAVVPDAEGTGSTLVTAGPGVTWESSFGDGSFARHRDLGCVPVAMDAATLRRDIDTADHLAEAQRLGLGPRTAALLAGR